MVVIAERGEKNENDQHFKYGNSIRLQVKTTKTNRTGQGNKTLNRLKNKAILNRNLI